MSNKVREYAENFVDGMDTIRNGLDNIPLSGKTGGKIGVALAFNPITGPILGPLALGAVATYGASRVVKKVLEKTK